MIDAFRSHCVQSYTGEFELLFGVSSLTDPAVAAVEQLKVEFPERTIRLIECPERLGTNGKVSTLVQLAAHARFDFLLINDSDITVSPRYLERVMACFAPAEHNGKAAQQVGLVTALYRGRAHGTLPSRLEALGIATDFMAGVLLSKWLEGGLHYGLGSTLAVSREALDRIGGLQVLVDHLADDYELGARVDKAGYRVALLSARWSRRTSRPTAGAALSITSCAGRERSATRGPGAMPDSSSPPGWAGRCSTCWPVERAR